MDEINALAYQRELNIALTQMQSLESTLRDLNGLKTKYESGVHESSLESQFSLIRLRISKGDFDYSLESEDTSSFSDKIKRLIEFIIEAIKKLADKIIDFFISTKLAYELRRKQIQSGFDEVKVLFSKLDNTKKPLSKYQGYMKNIYIARALCINGEISVSKLIGNISHLSNALRDSSTFTQNSLLNQSRLFRIISNEDSEYSQLKLLIPATRLSMCSFELNKDEYNKLNIDPNIHIAYKSKEFAGNRSIVHVGLRYGVKLSELDNDYKGDEVDAIAWIGNKHGYLPSIYNFNLDFGKITNRGFGILSIPEMKTLINSINELLRIIASMETDLEILNSHLKKVKYNVGLLRKNESLSPYVLNILPVYLTGSIKSTISLYTSLFNIALSISQQSSTWIRSSISFYD